MERLSHQMAQFCVTAGAAAVVAVTLQGCGESESPATTMTTTFACPPDHIPWPTEGFPPFDCQTNAAVKQEAHLFLKSSMPPWDVENAETLEEGILGPTVNISLMARDEFPWAEHIPKDIWLNYVLPYANVNEPRVDWRTLLLDRLRSLVQNPTYEANTTLDVISVMNEKLWSTLRKPAIKFKGGQTPLIYDPMSTIDFGFASCTGVSILLVDSLRAVGVPARIVGTPAWQGNESNGNHNWVEIWLGPGQGLDGEEWTFIEGKPAWGAAESLTNPCDKWFCNAAHFDGKTKVFAPQYDRSTNKTIYPMAWDLQNENIPGVDRSDFYNTMCQPCKDGTETFTTTTTTTSTTSTATSTTLRLCAPLDNVNCDNDSDLDHKETSTPEACCEFCTQSKGCNAWTWNRNTTEDKHMCYLKSDCKSHVSDSDTISGSSTPLSHAKAVVV